MDQYNIREHDIRPELTHGKTYGKKGWGKTQSFLTTGQRQAPIIDLFDAEEPTAPVWVTSEPSTGVFVSYNQGGLNAIRDSPRVMALLQAHRTSLMTPEQLQVEAEIDMSYQQLGSPTTIDPKVYNAQVSELHRMAREYRAQEEAAAKGEWYAFLLKEELDILNQRGCDVVLIENFLGPSGLSNPKAIAREALRRGTDNEKYVDPLETSRYARIKAKGYRGFTERADISARPKFLPIPSIEDSIGYTPEDREEISKILDALNNTEDPDMTSFGRRAVVARVGKTLYAILREYRAQAAQSEEEVFISVMPVPTSISLDHAHSVGMPSDGAESYKARFVPNVIEEEVVVPRRLLKERKERRMGVITDHSTYEADPDSDVSSPRGDALRCVRVRREPFVVGGYDTLEPYRGDPTENSHQAAHDAEKLRKDIPFH